jgi:hypothetical protein
VSGFTLVGWSAQELGLKGYNWTSAAGIALELYEARARELPERKRAALWSGRRRKEKGPAEAEPSSLTFQPKSKISLRRPSR